MGLVSAVMGFLLRKGGGILALLLTLFVGYLMVQILFPSVRDAVADRERLSQVARERAALESDLSELRRSVAQGEGEAIDALRGRLEEEIAVGRAQMAEKKQDVKRLRDRQGDACDFGQQVVDFLTPGNKCAAAEKALAEADAALDGIEAGVERAEADAAIVADPELTPAQKLARLGEDGRESPHERQVRSKEAQLEEVRAEESGLKRSREAGVGWVVDHWARSWKWLLGIALVVMFGPPLMRIINYFLLMPIVRRVHRPLRLAELEDDGAAAIRTSSPQRSLTVELSVDEVLSARSEYVRPVQGATRSRLLYDWRAPFISYAAGLYALTRLTGGGRLTSATLAASDDPNTYLMRIDLEHHPGLAIHPKHVVGVIGDPVLTTRWHWGLHSLVSGQVRYILFGGTGSIIVQGSGNVEVKSPGSVPVRMDQHLVMGFDSRLQVAVTRTETFYPYVGGRTGLVVNEFFGPHPFFWQLSSPEGPINPMARTFNAFFSAVGKLLGF